MNDDKIISSLKKSIDNAPIDLLNAIKKQSIPKMLRHDEITRQTTKSKWNKTVAPIMSLAAVLVMMFGLWQFQSRLPDSYVYLDVNPSVEIITNKNDKVIDLVSFNEDGKTIIENVDFKGRDVALVTEEIVIKMINLEYIKTSNDYLLLSVYNKDHEKKEQQKIRLNSAIHNLMGKEDFVPIILVQNIEMTSTIENYAKEYGISPSKMTFIRNMIILNPQLKAEDLVELSLQELVSLGRTMELDLESIIQSDDFHRIPDLDPVQDYYDDDDDDDDEDDEDEDDEDEEEQKIDEGNIPSQRKIISREEATRIALSLTGGGKITSIELDEGDDETEYEIEIEKDGLVYDIEIDAYTGRVLDFDVEDDDD